MAHAPAERQIPGDAEPDDEDDMPPLEYVTTSAGQQLTPQAQPAKDSDDDDDMPPLVCSAAPIPSPSAGLSGVRLSASAATPDSDDDMPPLDYVGTPGHSAASSCNQAPAQQHGVPSGGQARVEAGTSGNDDDDDDDDMPPLEYVGSNAQSAPSSVKALAVPSIGGEDADDDDMPPLDYGGSSGPSAVSSCKQVPGQQRGVPSGGRAGVEVNKSGVNDDDDDDDMPPLEYVGSHVQSAPSSMKAPAGTSIGGEDADDDDMPPLDYVGASGPSTASSCNQAPAQQHLPGVGAGTRGVDDDDDDLPPLEDIGSHVQSAPSSMKGPAVTSIDGDDDDDDMPPLDCVGQSAPPVTKSHEQDSDDDMPPLDYVGTSLQNLAQQPVAAIAGDSDDDMPPLEYIGTVPQAAKSAATASTAGGSDDDMPPLDYMGTAKTPGSMSTAQPTETAPEKKAAPWWATGAATRKKDNAGDDMPPLIYVGLGPNDAFEFKEGDAVVLHGLSKAELNGKEATILPFTSATPKDRLPVKLLHSAQKLSVKPTNLQKKAPCSIASRSAQTPQCANCSEDPVGVPSEGFREGDKVILHGLSRAELNGQDATILRFDRAQIAQKGRFPVRLNKSGQQLSIKLENLKRFTSTGPDRDALPAKVPEKTQDEDADMPPLVYVGVESVPKYHFMEGDAVILKGLSDSMYNGRCGRILPFDAKIPGRVAVSLGDSDKKLSVKVENLEKVDTKHDDLPPLEPVASAAISQKGTEDGDDMPPLEYTGSRQPTTAPCGVQKNAEEDDDDMPPLEYMGVGQPTLAAPTAALQNDRAEEEEEHEDDDDDMPPLEYVGSSRPAPSTAFQKDARDDGDDDDDMPPLEYIGSGQPAPAAATAALQKNANDDDADDMPPLEYAGSGRPVAEAAMRLQKEAGEDAAAAADDDDDDDRMPPLEYAGSGQHAPAVATEALQNADDDENDMPPLEYAGTGRPAVKVATVLQKDAGDDDDDDMPPLEYVGSGQPAPAAATEALQKSTEDCDDMPPLDYAGSGRPALAVATAVLQKDVQDDMPPLAHAGSGRLVAEGATGASDDDDDMPPLEYMGSGYPPAPGAATATLPKYAEDDDDDMPPLDYVGACSAGVAPEAAQAMAAGPQDDDDDDMPPLEYGGGGSAELAAPPATADPAVQIPDDIAGVSPSDCANSGAGRASGSTTDADQGAKKEAVDANTTADDVNDDDGMPPLDALGTDSGGTPAAPAASPADRQDTPREILAQWCQDNQLPPELVDRLLDEEVTDPLELAAVGEEELAAFAAGFKLGPRGRFMRAVQRMREASTG